MPGLLIEYLINGAIAILWISRLIDIEELTAIAEGHTKGLILIPVAYVLGMCIDYIAWWVTQIPKQMIRDHAAKTVEKAMTDADPPFLSAEYKYFWKEKIEIEKSYPDLNKAMSSRSSRDRIARGTIFNLIPISILYVDVMGYWGVVLIALAILMWARFEHYNRCFELRAAYSVRNGR